MAVSAISMMVSSIEPYFLGNRSSTKWTLGEASFAFPAWAHMSTRQEDNVALKRSRNYIRLVQAKDPVTTHLIFQADNTFFWLKGLHRRWRCRWCSPSLHRWRAWHLCGRRRWIGVGCALDPGQFAVEPLLHGRGFFATNEDSLPQIGIVYSKL